jgi:SAM-dependent methyltransferase
VNDRHLAICASPEWAFYVEHELLPWVLEGRDLGDDVLELGPGPGLTTDVLMRLVPRLTAIELDLQLAAALASRLAGTHVDVVCGDATATGLPSAAYSAVTCFTMLHHIPTAEGQDRLFAEARRLLRPGGLFVGTDGLDTPERRALHVDDIFVPVKPETLPARLTAAGLRDPAVAVDGDRIRFAATSP